jgi:hypothetical protein
LGWLWINDCDDDEASDSLIVQLSEYLLLCDYTETTERSPVDPHLTRSVMLHSSSMFSYHLAILFTKMLAVITFTNSKSFRLAEIGQRRIQR